MRLGHYTAQGWDTHLPSVSEQPSHLRRMHRCSVRLHPLEKLRSILSSCEEKRDSTTGSAVVGFLVRGFFMLRSCPFGRDTTSLFTSPTSSIWFLLVPRRRWQPTYRGRWMLHCTFCPCLGQLSRRLFPSRYTRMMISGEYPPHSVNF